MKHAIDRRSFLALAAASAAACAAPLKATTERRFAFDCVIQGGRVFDGTGGVEWTSDIGLLGDTIVAFGEIDIEQSRSVIDARGLCVAPGFIDMHTHSDGDVLVYPDDESRVFQGVTTEVTGNCGSSAAPLCGDEIEANVKELREKGIDARWSDVSSYFKTLESTRIATNQALLLGQGTLRQTVAHMENRPLKPSELAEILRLLEEGLDQGAVGFSTGLEYTPGRFTPTDELIAMARVLARRGKLYASHMRSEESQFLEAIDETLRIGRESGARVQVSHLKACGKPNWYKQDAAIAALERARAHGIEVLADAYPYTAYSTGLTVFLSDEARAGGDEALIARLKDPAERAKIRTFLEPRVASDPGGFELIVIASVGAGRNRDAIGIDLATIARKRKVEPAEALLQLLEEENASVGFIGHGMSEENVVEVLTHPLVMIGSDGRAMAPRGKALETKPHPRSYGTFARVLAKYVRLEQRLDLATAIKKMTSMPASQLGFEDRGRIGRNMKADLVIFDPTKVQDNATFDDPQRTSTGFSHVLVNGVAVLKDGSPTGARPGRALR